LGAITLSASIEGRALEPAVFEAAGLAMYVREVAASGEVEVRFQVDKALPPDEDDARERGVIVAAISIA
jgi:hypothetical protein